MRQLLFLLLLISSGVTAQTINDYTVYLKPKQIPQLMGIQSYAFGQHDGKWIIIGGRLDGLHRRQPFAAFDSIGHNNQILVIDPRTNELWKASVDQLSPSLRNQLKATNTCFTQDGDQLLLVGGYGINQLADDHQTFPYLTTIHLPDLVKAVQEGQINDPLFQQLEDSLFAVTGGQLLKMNNTFHIVGGHRFDGRYNPADRPTFTQTYTNSVRRFTLDENGKPTFLVGAEDSLLMHRRDFNVVLGLTASNKPYLTAFSGVFQYGVDLPYQSTILIDNVGLTEQPNFRQYYNHYHCPDISLYEPTTGAMHTIFFGGIAQFYDSLGILVQDNSVPFVSTISRVSRFDDGSMSEFKLPVEMPALLGAGGEFIPNPTLPRLEAGVIRFDAGQDSIFLGTILGGIASTARAIFWTNDDEESAAFSGMFEVYLVKSTVPQTKNKMSTSSLDLRAVRNQAAARYQVQFTLEKPTLVSIQWTNKRGKVKHKATFMGKAGTQLYPVFLPEKAGFCCFQLTVNDVVTKQYFLIPEEE